MNLRSIAVWGIVGLASACTTAQRQVRPDPTPAAISAAQAAASPAPPASRAATVPIPAPVPEEKLEGVKSWKDPAVVTRLARDCRWKPAGLDKNDGMSDRNPMSCVLEVEQSCVPDPCFDEEQQTCKPACVKTCGECGDECTTRCEACKGTCKDDACRQTCAAQCGECRDGCLRAEDRCRTGTCGQAYSECRKKMAAEWKRSTCKAACPKVLACAAKCWNGPDEDSDVCTASCKKRFMVGCPERFFGFCVFNTSPLD